MSELIDCHKEHMTTKPQNQAVRNSSLHRTLDMIKSTSKMLGIASRRLTWHNLEKISCERRFSYELPLYQHIDILHVLRKLEKMS